VKYDLAVVGHIVLDYIGHNGRFRGPILGGPAVYASLTARALDASVTVTSTVGQDVGHKRLARLHNHGISTRHIRVANSTTTSFKIDYHSSGRSMKVVSICDAIRAEDLLRCPEANAVHIGPVLCEVPASHAARLARRNAVVCLDPQGYFRHVAPDGSVRVRNWRENGLLKEIEVLKVSEDELKALIGNSQSTRKLAKLGPDIVFITKGSKGSLVWSREEGTFRVPAYKTRVVDPTGAGDAMAGAFLISWNRTNDLIWSVAMGSAVASFVVEKLGPSNFGTRRQIRNRAQAISEQTIRV
jgi:sugar/nucleoside kinase (ribokinase family)